MLQGAEELTRQWEHPTQKMAEHLCLGVDSLAAKLGTLNKRRSNEGSDLVIATEISALR
jgi:hypothetical protein